MNIELQSCSLAMLFVLLVLFLNEKSLDLSSRRLFFRTLVSCIVCLSLDIASIVCIYESTHAGFPVAVTKVFCKLYVVSLIFQAYEAFLYAAGEFFTEGSNRRLQTLYRLWLLTGLLGVALRPINFVMNYRMVYSFGPSVRIAYLVVLLFILSSIYMAFRGSRRSSVRRRRCILLWQFSWLAAAAIQFFNPELLLAGFATAFSVALIYAELENPHEGIDRMTGQFTSNALSSYLDDLYRHHRSFAAMHVRVEYRMESVDPETERATMLRVSNFLNQDKSAYVFRQADDELVVTYATEEQMRASYERIAADAARTLDLPAKLHYTLIPDGTVMNSTDEFMRFHHYLERSAQGQDCITVGRESMEEIREYLRVQQMISLALTEGRVEVFFQPIYNVARRRFTSAEALVRIRDVDGSLISPGVFIPVAEENGLIVPLGYEIFRQVCAFLATGRAQALGLEYVEVNLSVVQFDDENPAAFVQSVMDEYAIKPSQINLEITETASTSARRVLLRNMDKLIARGVRFSLDDFGTGRSNLDYFVDMPVDIIKFDYSFTQGYFRNDKARCVVESVTDLMRRVGMPIVAEGVETEEQLKAMCDLGISFIQGFYFSQPIPSEEFLAFLEEHNAAA